MAEICGQPSMIKALSNLNSSFCQGIFTQLQMIRETMEETHQLLNHNNTEVKYTAFIILLVKISHIVPS